MTRVDPRDTNAYVYTIRPKVYEIAKGKCYACRKAVGPGTKHKSWECHHIRPVCRGGTNALTNLVCLCLKCHNFVHSEDVRYRRKLSHRQYFIGVDRRTGKRIVRWWDHVLVHRKRTTSNPRLRRLYELAT
jgi:5-methylcytosine-specific restriction endonuclease McrA